MGPNISAVLALIGPEITTVKRIDISVMQTNFIVALLIACIAIIGINKRSTISAMRHRCAIRRSVIPSNKKSCSPYDTVANIECSRPDSV